MRKRKVIDCLNVYDPRQTGFDIHIDATGTRFWNTADHDVVFFETRSYGYYSHASHFQRLLEVVAKRTCCEFIGFRISPKGEVKSVPCSLAGIDLDDAWGGGIGRESLGELMAFFDETASYEAWTFYGLGAKPHDPSILLPFEKALESFMRYKFVVCVDLDGGMWGYVMPHGDMDILISEIKTAGIVEKK